MPLLIDLSLVDSAENSSRSPLGEIGANGSGACVLITPVSETGFHGSLIAGETVLGGTGLADTGAHGSDAKLLALEIYSVLVLVLVLMLVPMDH